MPPTFDFRCKFQLYHFFDSRVCDVFTNKMPFFRIILELDQV